MHACMKCGLYARMRRNKDGSERMYLFQWEQGGLFYKELLMIYLLILLENNLEMFINSGCLFLSSILISREYLLLFSL
jgi:hypothetical protein